MKRNSRLTKLVAFVVAAIFACQTTGFAEIARDRAAFCLKPTFDYCPDEIVKSLGERHRAVRRMHILRQIIQALYAARNRAEKPIPWSTAITKIRQYVASSVDVFESIEPILDSCLFRVTFATSLKSRAYTIGYDADGEWVFEEAAAPAAGSGPTAAGSGPTAASSEWGSVEAAPADPFTQMVQGVFRDRKNAYEVESVPVTDDPNRRIYKARETSGSKTGRVVVIKIARPEADKNGAYHQFMQDTLKVWQRGGVLKGRFPNLVRLYEAGFIPIEDLQRHAPPDTDVAVVEALAAFGEAGLGLHYQVMEFLDGRDLETLLTEGFFEDKGGDLSAVIDFLTDKLVGGIHKVHRKGLVHGELLLHDVMIDDEMTWLKIGDLDTMRLTRDFPGIAEWDRAPVQRICEAVLLQAASQTPRINRVQEFFGEWSDEVVRERELPAFARALKRLSRDIRRSTGPTTASSEWKGAGQPAPEAKVVAVASKEAHARLTDSLLEVCADIAYALKGSLIKFAHGGDSIIDPHTLGAADMLYLWQQDDNVVISVVGNFNQEALSKAAGILKKMVEDDRFKDGFCDTPTTTAFALRHEIDEEIEELIRLVPRGPASGPTTASPEWGGEGQPVQEAKVVAVASKEAHARMIRAIFAVSRDITGRLKGSVVKLRCGGYAITDPHTLFVADLIYLWEEGDEVEIAVGGPFSMEALSRAAGILKKMVEDPKFKHGFHGDSKTPLAALRHEIDEELEEVARLASKGFDSGPTTASPEFTEPPEVIIGHLELEDGTRVEIRIDTVRHGSARVKFYKEFGPLMGEAHLVLARHDTLQIANLEVESGFRGEGFSRVMLDAVLKGLSDGAIMPECGFEGTITVIECFPTHPFIAKAIEKYGFERSLPGSGDDPANMIEVVIGERLPDGTTPLYIADKAKREAFTQRATEEGFSNDFNFEEQPVEGMRLFIDVYYELKDEGKAVLAQRLGNPSYNDIQFYLGGPATASPEFGDKTGGAGLSEEQAREMMAQARDRWELLGACREHAIYVARRCFEAGFEVRVMHDINHWWVEQVEPDGYILDANTEGLSFTVTPETSYLLGERIVAIRRNLDEARTLREAGVYVGEPDDRATEQARREADNERFYRDELRELDGLCESRLASVDMAPREAEMFLPELEAERARVRAKLAQLQKDKDTGPTTASADRFAKEMDGPERAQPFSRDELEFFGGMLWTAGAEGFARELLEERTVLRWGRAELRGEEQPAINTRRGDVYDCEVNDRFRYAFRRLHKGLYEGNRLLLSRDYLLKMPRVLGHEFGEIFAERYLHEVEGWDLGNPRLPLLEEACGILSELLVYRGLRRALEQRGWYSVRARDMADQFNRAIGAAAEHLEWMRDIIRISLSPDDNRIGDLLEEATGIRPGTHLAALLQERLGGLGYGQLTPGEFELVHRIINEVIAPSNATLVAEEVDRVDERANHLSRLERVLRLHLEANDHYRAGNVGRAEELFREALAIGENRAATLSHLARVYVRMGKHDDAIRCAAEAIEIDPDNPHSYRPKARGHRFKGQFEEGAATCRQRLEQRPDDHNMRVELALNLIGLGDGQAAKDAILKIPQGRRGEGARRTLVRAEELIASGGRNIGGSLKEQVDLLLAEARRHITDGRYAEAEEALLHARRLDAKHLSTLSMLARVYSDTGRHDEVLECSREMVRIRPKDPRNMPAYSRQGQALIALGRCEEAREILAEGLEVDNDNFWLLDADGEAAIELGQYDDAVDRFTRALATHPPDKYPIVKQLARAQKLAGNPEEARQVLRRPIKNSPRNYRLLLEDADAAIATGELDDAAGNCRRALDLSRGNRIAYQLLAECRRLQGSIGASMNACVGGLRHNPGDPALLAQMSLVLTDSGEFSSARDVLRKARERDVRLSAETRRIIEAADRHLEEREAAAEATLGAAVEAPSESDRESGPTKERQFVALVAQAAAYSGAGRYKEALVSAREALSIDKDNVQAHIAFATAQAGLGRARKVREACEAGLSIDPENAELLALQKQVAKTESGKLLEGLPVVTTDDMSDQKRALKKGCSGQKKKAEKLPDHTVEFLVRCGLSENPRALVGQLSSISENDVAKSASIAHLTGWAEGVLIGTLKKKTGHPILQEKDADVKAGVRKFLETAVRGGLHWQQIQAIMGNESNLPLSFPSTEEACKALAALQSRLESAMGARDPPETASPEWQSVDKGEAIGSLTLGDGTRVTIYVNTTGKDTARVRFYTEGGEYVGHVRLHAFTPTRLRIGYIEVGKDFRGAQRGTQCSYALLDSVFKGLEEGKILPGFNRGRISVTANVVNPLIARALGKYRFNSRPRSTENSESEGQAKVLIGESKPDGKIPIYINDGPAREEFAERIQDQDGYEIFELKFDRPENVRDVVYINTDYGRYASISSILRNRQTDCEINFEEPAAGPTTASSEWQDTDKGLNRSTVRVKAVGVHARNAGCFAWTSDKINTLLKDADVTLSWVDEDGPHTITNPNGVAGMAPLFRVLKPYAFKGDVDIAIEGPHPQVALDRATAILAKIMGDEDFKDGFIPRLGAAAAKTGIELATEIQTDLEMLAVEASVQPIPADVFYMLSAVKRPGPPPTTASPEWLFGKRRVPAKDKKVKPVKWKNKKPSVLFVKLKSGSRGPDRGHKAVDYLTIGSLASALRNRNTLRKFGNACGRDEFAFESEEEYPDFDVHVVDLAEKHSDVPVEEYLEEYVREHGIKPVMVCTSPMSRGLDEAKKVAEAADRLMPKALKVAGGAHASVAPGECLERAGYDVACIGAGVEAIMELAFEVNARKDIDLSKVSNIAFKDAGGQVQLTTDMDEAPEYVLDINEYPDPSDSLGLFINDVDDNPEENAKTLAYIYAGQGCAWNCAFCAQKAIHRGVIRERSADVVFAEIKKLWGKGFRRFSIIQESFTRDKKRIVRFLELIEEEQGRNPDFRFGWSIEARADQLTYELLARMKESGLQNIDIGLETGDQAILDSVNKGVKLEQVKKVIEWCGKIESHDDDFHLGISTHLYMMVGLPGQDWQSILRSAIFLKENPPFDFLSMSPNVFIAMPYLGTELAELGGITVLMPEDGSLDWPDRMPDAFVAEGELKGENFTETGAMVSGEILEAHIYLEEYGHALLTNLYHIAYHVSHQYGITADHILYMLERRTIRDLIVRAQEGLDPEKRKAAYEEILERDGNEERDFETVRYQFDGKFRGFSRFLASINFSNGFDTMKCLEVKCRIKWMRLCAVIWALLEKKFEAAGFDVDSEAVGAILNSHLQGVNTNTLNTILKRIENYQPLEELEHHVTIDGNTISAFGLKFTLDEATKTLILNTGGMTPGEIGPTVVASGPTTVSPEWQGPDSAGSGIRNKADAATPIASPKGMHVRNSVSLIWTAKKIRELLKDADIELSWEEADEQRVVKNPSRLDQIGGLYSPLSLESYKGDIRISVEGPYKGEVLASACLMLKKIVGDSDFEDGFLPDPETEGARPGESLIAEIWADLDELARAVPADALQPGKWDAMRRDRGFLSGPTTASPEWGERRSRSLPPDSVFYSLSAAKARREGNTYRAERLIERAIALDDNDVRTWTEYAVICLETDRIGKAYQCIEKALGIASGDNVARAVWARILLADNRPAEAVDVLERLAAGAPDLDIRDLLVTAQRAMAKKQSGSEGPTTASSEWKATGVSGGDRYVGQQAVAQRVIEFFASRPFDEKEDTGYTKEELSRLEDRVGISSRTMLSRLPPVFEALGLEEGTQYFEVGSGDGSVCGVAAAYVGGENAHGREIRKDASDWAIERKAELASEKDLARLADVDLAHGDAFDDANLRLWKEADVIFCAYPHPTDRAEARRLMDKFQDYCLMAKPGTRIVVIYAPELRRLEQFEITDEAPYKDVCYPSWTKKRAKANKFEAFRVYEIPKELPEGMLARVSEPPTGPTTASSEWKKKSGEAHITPQVARKLMQQTVDFVNNMGECRKHAEFLAQRLIEDGYNVVVVTDEQHWWVEEVREDGYVLDVYPKGLSAAKRRRAFEFVSMGRTILRKNSAILKELQKHNVYVRNRIDEASTKKARLNANSEEFYLQAVAEREAFIAGAFGHKRVQLMPDSYLVPCTNSLRFLRAKLKAIQEAKAPKGQAGPTGPTTASSEWKTAAPLPAEFFDEITRSVRSLASSAQEAEDRGEELVVGIDTGIWNLKENGSELLKALGELQGIKGLENIRVITGDGTELYDRLTGYLGDKRNRDERTKSVVLIKEENAQIFEPLEAQITVVAISDRARPASITRLIDLAMQGDREAIAELLRFEAAEPVTDDERRIRFIEEARYLDKMA